MNDFCNKLEADYSQWDQQITTLKNSYLEARPDGRFAICIPCSSCGILDNAAGSFTLKQNAAMWNFRDHLIKQFDRREQDGFYLIDTAITVDNEYGYRYLPKNDVTIPYAGCPDDVILNVQTGNHPYNSYPNMGVPIALLSISANNAPDAPSFDDALLITPYWIAKSRATDTVFLARFIPTLKPKPTRLRMKSAQTLSAIPKSHL